MKPEINLILAAFSFKVTSSRRHSNFTLALSPRAMFILVISAAAIGLRLFTNFRQASRFN
jgi:hypothetical protein